MRSRQVILLYGHDVDGFSDLQVLYSAAGYYIGTTFTDEHGDEGPGSRDSVDYYPTRQAAQHALNTNTFNIRLHP